jgi:hypothetical protein
MTPLARTGGGVLIQGKSSVSWPNFLKQKAPGVFAELVFALGIIGTGLLAIPVLAGLAAYVGLAFDGDHGIGQFLNDLPLLRRAEHFLDPMCPPTTPC